MIAHALHTSRTGVWVGSLLRGAPRQPSPFLLCDQFLHKSVVLVWQQSQEYSLGLLLNRVTSAVHMLRTADGRVVAQVPVRYGGSCGNQDSVVQGNGPKH